MRQEWVDDYGDDYGLRVEILESVHRSRRRSRQPKWIEKRRENVLLILKERKLA